MFSAPCKTFASNTRLRFTALTLILFITAGCATTQSAQQIDRLESVKENPRVILMPPDIRYYLLTTGGISEPHAEWTEAAQTNFTAAIQDFAGSIGTDLTIIDRNNLGETHIQYEKLHSAVGMTILQHQFGMFKLPSKGNGQVFDWSLGPEISALADQHDADYGLFVYYRDYQASGGRVAFAILAAAMGAGVTTGAEQGFASLVDLRTGDIVWFNVVTAGSGELRDESGAATTVNTLFRDIPTKRGASESE
jgi:hypothetical protein